MAGHDLTLSVLAETFAVCRLDPHAPIPDWSLAGSLVSVTRTDEELSIVCPQRNVPQGTPGQRGWRCLRVEGPLDLSLVGIVASLAASLAQAGIPLFALSTYDTDYLMVREEDLAGAVRALRAAGHRVHWPAGGDPIEGGPR